MNYKWSSEIYRPAAEGVRRCGNLISPFIEARFSEGMLAASSAELLYVPIVMPAEMHDRYKERSRLKVCRKAVRVRSAPRLPSVRERQPSGSDRRVRPGDHHKPSPSSTSRPSCRPSAGD